MVKLRVRARAVDMLGRQQIAGIPTAIHELFKNAHDAYAERVEVDYFRRNKVLVLRDDGYGMTREDVENRWLTLGTESRVNANRPDGVEDWTGPKQLPRRAIMGEKGIGRLAIAVIAPITLLLTRAARPGGLGDLVVALVHWGLFEQPGLDIGAIDVPIIELPGGHLPGRGEIHGLVQRVEENILELRDELDVDAFDLLNTQLEKIKNIAPDRLDQTLRVFLKKDEQPLSLAGEGYGTHFILLPTAPELDDDIDGGSDKDASNLRKHLLGFANTMTGNQPVITAEFRDHNLNEYPDELIGPSNFFLPEEYEKADHHFTGTFDEYGQFSGTVDIYGEKKPFVCNWVEGRGRPLKCGPFFIEFAYVMGLLKESKIPVEDYSNIFNKVDRIGGLYIYRNGVRVLPYGDTDYDFLEMEKRRSKRPTDWFFTFRRMFGYISITHEHNGNLNDKAGREGFRHNQAYRDFRAVLINFFIRLAMEFFRPSAPQSEIFWDQKNALQAEAEIIENQKKKAEARRKDFSKFLDAFFTKYEGKEFEERVAEIRSRAVGSINLLLQLEDDGELVVRVRKLEEELAAAISALSSEISIFKPRGFALSKKLERDWAAYQGLAASLQSEFIVPLRQEITELLKKSTARRISEEQRRQSVFQLVEKQKELLVRDLSALRRETYAASEEMSKTLRKVIKEEFSLFRKETEELLIDFMKKSASDPEALDGNRLNVERSIEAIRVRESSLLDAIRRQMLDLSEALRDRETHEDRIGALEQRAQRLEEQLDFYSDFAQMGMGVGILQHEFEKSAQHLRTAIKDLKPWADGTPALKLVYRRMRDSFDHLDGYLKMLDPLGRRLYRTKIEVSGDEIRIHLLRIFRAALEENNIELKATDDFLSRR
ncbi:MAG: ATP-binding protein, partial [Desulfobulbaceae bacterium]|nr:ATP-binding protein [Desulfobulbaceae bacterium]